MISLTAKFAVVSAICRCSSVKSSGKKQSAAVGSVMEAAAGDAGGRRSFGGG
jgi:hypothetical protein